VTLRVSLASISPASGNRWALWTTLCVIVIVGAWFRFHNLGADSLWLDEAASWLQSNGGLADLISRTAQDNYPPLHNLFLYASINLFGDGEWSLRLPSAIFGTANILAIYWLGSMTGGRIVGLLAAAFLALSGFHIWYSQEARMYALLSLTATLFAASSFYFVRSPTIPRAALVSLAGLALLYSHPFGTLNWIAIVTGISLFTLTAPVIVRRTIAVWVVSNIVAAAAFAPWAWLLLRRAENINRHGFWIPYPSTERVYSTLIDLVSGHYVAALLFVGFLLALFPARYAVSAEKPILQTNPLAVFFVWAGLPIALALLISFVSTPIFLNRYLIGSLPALLLAGAYGLSRFARGWAGFGIVAILSVAVLTTSYFRYTTNSRDDWRGVSAMLEERLRPTDCVLIYRSYMKRPLSYYYRKQVPCQSLPGSEADLELKDIAGDRLFVVLSHASQAEIDQILETLRSDLWLVRQEFPFHRVDMIEFGKAN
jgi:mannosyltransferase